LKPARPTITTKASRLFWRSAPRCSRAIEKDFG
jgi:hypothetical protein